MKKATVIGSANQKGGQGKSQGTHFLAMVLSTIKKKKVLIIDFDPQAAQNVLFGFSEDILEDNPLSNVSLIFEKRVDDIEPLKVSKRVDAILSDYTLMEYSERVIKNKENLLKKLVERFRDSYDYIIIDSNPTGGSLMTSVVLASDKLFVPVKTNLLDEKGTKGFFDELASIIDSYDKDIQSITIVPNLFESNVNDQKESLSNIKNNYARYIESLGFTGEISVTPPIPKRSLFGTASSDPDINNIVKFIDKKAKANRDILTLLKKITSITTGED